MRRTVSEAVILMAGSGSRLGGGDSSFLKPLVPVLGRPLISYTFDALLKGEVQKVNLIVGYESKRMTGAIKSLIPPGLESRFIENRNWQKQNGISLLAAARHVTTPFLLTMSDHLFDNMIVGLLISSTDPSVLNVAVDRKLDSIFDLDDAMKVRMHGNQVTAIGKNLRDYNAVDTGLFICPPEIFSYLERAKSDSCRNDCSLADGIRLMARDDKVRAIDIGDAWWQDVDTPEMLQHAERQLAQGMRSGVI